MVKLLVYGYATGVFSSRKIERRLHDDLAFRMLGAGNFPKHRTLSDFRARHLEELAALGFGDLRVGEGGADGAVGIEARETGRGGIGEVGIEAFRETESAQAATGGLGKDVIPIDGKSVAGWHLLAVAEGLVEEGVRFGEEEEGVLGEEVEEGTEFGFGVRSGGGGVVVGWGASGGLEKAEFAGRWDDDFGNGLAGDLGLGVEFAERFEVIAEELQSDWPRRRERPEVDDAAAPREFAFAGDLGLGFVALFLEPFDEVEWVEGVAAAKGAGAGPEIVAGEGPLEQGDDGGDDDAWAIGAG
jgi:hypothetical protein